MNIIKASMLCAFALAGLSTAHAESNKTRLQTFARLPNWSGLWELDIGIPIKDGELTSSEARQLDNFVQSFKPPLNAAAQAVYAQKYQELQNAPTSSAGGSGCKLPPMSTAMSYLGEYKFLLTPEEVVMTQTENGVRHIYTDGRRHPAAEDLWPAPLGDSIGYWEGDTLVIDTVASTPVLLLPVTVPNGITALSLPVSNQAHFKERIRMLDQNHLEDQLTMEDPLTFTVPWKRTIQYKRAAGIDRMVYMNCAENERNPAVNGQVTTTVR